MNFGVQYSTQYTVHYKVSSKNQNGLYVGLGDLL